MLYSIAVTSTDVKPAQPHANARPSRYRFDLDGLRGIAIALVVAFHVYVGRVSGGVDVFLLLSGFFFLGAQYRNAINPRQSINPWWSIWRTIRRLFPALALVLAAVSVTVIFAVPVLRTLDNAHQVEASLLYYQNYALAIQGADYAAADRETSPLQHLWSMSVQGQFYLGAILLIFLLSWLTRSPRIVGAVTSVAEARRIDATRGRLRAILLPTLWIITIASGAYAFYLHDVNQGWNYYSTATRLWELCLGGALGLALTRRVPTLPTWASTLLAAAGLTLVISTGFLFDGAAQFPGPWTLWPLIGAALIIVAGPDAGFVSKFLASRPARSLGQWAYALYLWHWPILILATHLLGQHSPSVALGTAVIALSLLLAYLTNRFVEIPLSQSSRRPTRIQPVFSQAVTRLRTSRAAAYRVAAAGMCVVAAVGMLSLQAVQQARIEGAIGGKLNPASYPGILTLSDGWEAPEATPKPDRDIIRDLWPEPAMDGCLAEGPEPVDTFITHKRWRNESEECIYGDVEGEKSLVMIGGSHIEHWFAPINAYAKNNGYQLHVLLRQGCPATLAPIEGVGDICVEWTELALERIDELDPEVAFTTSTRPGFQLDEPEFGDYVPDGYIEFFDAMEARGTDFVAIRDTPWAFDEDFNQFSPTTCESHDDCVVRRKLALSATNPANEVLEDYVHGWNMDFSNLFCDDKTCHNIIGNIYVYRDSNHITDELALTFAPILERRLDTILS